MYRNNGIVQYSNGPKFKFTNSLASLTTERLTFNDVEFTGLHWSMDVIIQYSVCESVNPVRLEPELR
jgi:uncharacterized protein YprB with RNaseH-like and TPR domain